MISIPLDHEIFAPYVPGYVPVSPSLQENRLCILLLYENWKNLNYAELIHSAFQVYYILLLLCIFILLTFEILILKLQLKILIYLFKKYSGIICNLILYFLSLLQMRYYTPIIKEIFLFLFIYLFFLTQPVTAARAPRRRLSPTTWRPRPRNIF